MTSSPGSITGASELAAFLRDEVARRGEEEVAGVFHVSRRTLRGLIALSRPVTPTIAHRMATSCCWMLMHFHPGTSEASYWWHALDAIIAAILPEGNTATLFWERLIPDVFPEHSLREDLKVWEAYRTRAAPPALFLLTLLRTADDIAILSIQAGNGNEAFTARGISLLIRRLLHATQEVVP
jgi:hypothetical protein